MTCVFHEYDYDCKIKNDLRAIRKRNVYFLKTNVSNWLGPTCAIRSKNVYSPMTKLNSRLELAHE